MYIESPIVAVLLCSFGYFFSYLSNSLRGWAAAAAWMSAAGTWEPLFGLLQHDRPRWWSLVADLPWGTSADYRKALGFEGRAQWDPAFLVYGGVLILGGLLWLFINPNRTVVPVDIRSIIDLPLLRSSTHRNFVGFWFAVPGARKVCIRPMAAQPVP